MFCRRLRRSANFLFSKGDACESEGEHEARSGGEADCLANWAQVLNELNDSSRPLNNVIWYNLCCFISRYPLFSSYHWLCSRTRSSTSNSFPHTPAHTLSLALAVCSLSFPPPLPLPVSSPGSHPHSLAPLNSHPLSLSSRSSEPCLSRSDSYPPCTCC